MAMSASCRGRAGPPGSSFAELLKELDWRNENRISLKNAADDDHRVRSHDVDYGVPNKFADVISADHGVVDPAARMMGASAGFEKELERNHGCSIRLGGLHD
jgi:hypothetical protein